MLHVVYCRFTVTVRIDNKEYGTGTGKSKKDAKAAAAKKTWDMIVQKVSELYELCIYSASNG